VSGDEVDLCEPVRFEALRLRIVRLQGKVVLGAGCFTSAEQRGKHANQEEEKQGAELSQKLLLGGEVFFLVLASLLLSEELLLLPLLRSLPSTSLGKFSAEEKVVEDIFRVHVLLLKVVTMVVVVTSASASLLSLFEGGCRAYLIILSTLGGI